MLDLPDPQHSQNILGFLWWKREPQPVDAVPRLLRGSCACTSTGPAGAPRHAPQDPASDQGLLPSPCQGHQEFPGPRAPHFLLLFVTFRAWL